MLYGELGLRVAQAEHDGRGYLILATTREREPRTHVMLWPGLRARVVGTEMRDTGRLVIVQLAVADARRWMERKGYGALCQLPKQGPSHDWWDPGEKYPSLRMTNSAGDVILCCRLCMTIKRADGYPSSPCRGPVKIELRQSPTVEAPHVG
jgi:hypothetical protein